ncbi:uncharacterized protein [Coffea arabica]|uniref:Uncharacterized protein n=1 Tax=Coffea arabica TaxID=13443 RepID=A0A6P6W0R4_COFAR
MASWSAEHATKAYLQTLKMGKRGKEPNVSEYIAALAAGNNSQLMVMVCAGSAGSTALALGAAARETGGCAVCILPGLDELHASRKALGCYAEFIELVVGDDARSLLLNEYQDADFVLVDCKMDEHESILLAAQKCLHQKKACLVGYNAIHCEPWIDSFKAHLLPIGGGLLVTRLPSSSSSPAEKFRGAGKKGNWVVKVDKITGEEHVYRTTFHHYHDQIAA